MRSRRRDARAIPRPRRSSRRTSSPCRPLRPARSRRRSRSTSTSSTSPRRSTGSRSSGGGPASRRRRPSASPSARPSHRSAGAASPVSRWRRCCGDLRVELVLTAHPTEAKRRTVLSKLQRIAATLSDLHRDDLVPPERAAAEPALRAEITALWLTDRARTARPAVTDEVRTGLYFVEHMFWDVLPRIHAELEAALAEHYPGLTVPRRWLALGSWIGGDRDGNPYVTAAVTAETLRLHRGLAVEQHRRALQDLPACSGLHSRRILGFGGRDVAPSRSSITRSANEGPRPGRRHCRGNGRVLPGEGRPRGHAARGAGRRRARRQRRQRGHDRAGPFLRVGLAERSGHAPPLAPRPGDRDPRAADAWIPRSWRGVSGSSASAPRHAPGRTRSSSSASASTARP